MKDFDSLRKKSRGKFSYQKFLKIKELARNTLEASNDILDIQLETILDLYFNLDKKIDELDNKISIVINEINPPTLSVKGIGPIICSAIISEFGDVKRSKSADSMLVFAALESSIIQSGTSSQNGKMVKHGFGHLRYNIINAVRSVFLHAPIFTSFYYKKRNESKSDNVALFHVAKKLIRVIYKLETQNIIFDSSKLR